MERKITAQRKPRILFLTLPEHGQANVHLAVLHSLTTSYRNASFHLGSFTSLAPRCPPHVIFHHIEGAGIGQRFKDMMVAVHNDPSVFHKRATAKPGFFGTLVAVVRLMPWSLHPESPLENISTTHSVESVVESIDPDVIVMDSLFDQASDAISKIDRRTLVLSPNTLKEVTSADQGLNIFTIPCTNTGYPYPLPWYLIPLNIICLLFMGLWIQVDPRFRAINKLRHAAGYTGGLPLFSPRKHQMLCMAIPELEYPCNIPPTVTPCGMITLPAAQLSSVDPELALWIAKRPTILIVLGSHIMTDEVYALNILRGLRALLRKRQDLQVLWKLKPLGQYNLDTSDLGDKLRVVNWLKADPISVLQTGQVICSVNHGGSNSYHEALSTGTPQIIQSAWFDCHDFGVRAEWLGVGVWGNKYHAPRCDADEFYHALQTVVGESPNTPSAVQMREKALQAAKTVQAYNNGRPGRDVAADHIWEAAIAAIDGRNVNRANTADGKSYVSGSSVSISSD